MQTYTPFMRYVTLLVFLCTCVSLIGGFTQEAEACWAADIACAAASWAADRACEELNVVGCLIAKMAADATCAWAQENLCGSSS